MLMEVIVMSLNESIVNEVIGFYVGSPNFNGIPLINLQQYIREDEETILIALNELIKIGAITLNYTKHPHIKQFDDFPVYDQLAQLRSGNQRFICVYPSEKLLRTQIFTSRYDDRPFTKMLLHGKPQFRAMYFDQQILEDYFHNPNYHVEFSNYSGSIKFHSDMVLLSTFGLGYKDSDPCKERVVTVYLRYLSALTPEQQQRWSMKLVNEKCHSLLEYHQDIIAAEWAENGPNYDIFIDNFIKLIRFGKKPRQKNIAQNSKIRSAYG